MKNFIETETVTVPVRTRVFEDYDKLDALAKKRGYHSVDQGMDKNIHDLDVPVGLVGLQNNCLHSGWVATMDDHDVKAKDQITLLNLKMAKCRELGEKIIVGFCQTGNFSIGYSIYVKKE
jgi:hypothetical protein